MFTGPCTIVSIAGTPFHATAELIAHGTDLEDFYGTLTCNTEQCTALLNAREGRMQINGTEVKFHVTETKNTNQVHVTGIA